MFIVAARAIQSSACARTIVSRCLSRGAFNFRPPFEWRAAEWRAWPAAIKHLAFCSSAPSLCSQCTRELTADLIQRPAGLRNQSNLYVHFARPICELFLFVCARPQLQVRSHPRVVVGRERKGSLS